MLKPSLYTAFAIFLAGSALGEVPAIPVKHPTIPSGEVAVMGISREMFPGIGVWTPEMGSGVSSWATTESVGDGLGMRINVPFSYVGRVVLDQTGVVINEKRNDLQQYKGVSFWVKGDGSSAHGVIGLGAALNHYYQFPLINDDWQKIFVDWSDFKPRISTNQTTSFISLGVMLPTENLDFFWVKEVTTYKYDRDKQITVFDNDKVAVKVWPYRGLLLHYDELQVEESEGIEFKVQGSGGLGSGRVGWTWSDNEPVEFKVDKKTYTTIRIPWKDLPPPFEVENGKRYISIAMNRSIGRSHHFVVDRLHYFKERQIEGIAPTDPENKGGDISAKPWIVRRDHLSEVRKKIENEEPLTIVFVGDEVMQGSGLMYTFRADRLPFTRTYWALFAMNFLQQTPYTEMSLAYEIFRVKDQKWHPITVPSAKRKRLNIVALGINGTTVATLNQQVDKIASYNPDLVVLQYGMNDYLYNDADGYGKDLDKLVAEIKGQNLPLILGAQVPVADAYPHAWLEGDTYWRRSVMFADKCREVADKHQVPYMDSHGAFYARGVHCLGDLYASHTQPNRRGHYTLAMLYLGFLSNEDVKIWKAVPDF